MKRVSLTSHAGRKDGEFQSISWAATDPEEEEEENQAEMVAIRSVEKTDGATTEPPTGMSGWLLGSLLSTADEVEDRGISVENASRFTQEESFVP